MYLKMSALLAVLVASSASAKIPDFSVKTAPEAIRDATNPEARRFYAELVEHAKRDARQMVADTKKTTGLRPSDLKKVDWDCLFWRTAASMAKNIRRRFPGLQPTAFADQMEATALDDDDCPDEGGPGSNGVKVYNAAINQVQADRGGWQRAELPEGLLRALQGMVGAGIGVGEVAPAPAGVVPLLGNPEGYMPPSGDPKPGEVL